MFNQKLKIAGAGLYNSQYHNDKLSYIIILTSLSLT